MMAALLTAALLSLFLLPFCRAEEDPLNYDQIILVSRCRARCVDTYVGLASSDAKCIANMNCYKCWGMCENLVKPAWEYMCLEKQRHVCNDGCQLACEFMDLHKDTETVAYDSDLWKIPETPVRSAESDTLLKVTWDAAVKDDGTGTAVVYTLMWTYDQMDTWSPVCTTTEVWADVDGPHYQFPGLDFLLLAITSDGLVAEAVPADLSSVTEQPLSPRPESAPLAVRVTVVESLLQATVTLPAGHEGDNYQVNWGRQDCDCETVAEAKQQTLIVKMTTDQETTFQLPYLTYNSKYWVEVELTHGQGSRVYFYTPQCETPDSSCTRCHQNPQVFKALNTIKTEPGRLIAEPVSTFTIVGFCVVCACVVVSMAVVLSYKHKQLMATLTAQAQNLRTRTASMRASLRSRTSSFRNSVRSKMSRTSGSSTEGRRRDRPHDIDINSPSASVLISSESGGSSPVSLPSIPGTPTSATSPRSDSSFTMPPLTTITEDEES